LFHHNLGWVYCAVGQNSTGAIQPPLSHMLTSLSSKLATVAFTLVIADDYNGPRRVVTLVGMSRSFKRAKRQAVAQLKALLGRRPYIFAFEREAYNGGKFVFGMMMGSAPLAMMGIGDDCYGYVWRSVAADFPDGVCQRQLAIYRAENAKWLAEDQAQAA
jgi:hypothetical protein